MADDKPSSSGNTALVTIIVALITVAGTIVVAYINRPSHRQRDRAIPTQPEPRPVAEKPAPAAADPTPLQPIMGPLQVNVGLMGGTDYDSMHLNSAQECSERCRNEAKCVAMTFTPDQTCWLKFKVSQSVQAAGFTSAIKTHE